MDLLNDPETYFEASLVDLSPLLQTGKRSQQFKDLCREVGDTLIAKDFEHELINGTISLEFRRSLSIYHRVIAQIEKRLNLPISGKFATLFQNYHLKYYTRSCYKALNIDPNICLLKALEHRHFEVFDDCMTRSHLIDKVTLQRALIYAVIKGYSSIVETLVYSLFRVYIPEINQILNEAFVCASFHGYIPIVRFLLHFGVNNIHEAVFQASSKGHADVIQLIFERIKDQGFVVVIDKALISASHNGHFDVVMYFLDHFEDMDIKTLRFLLVNAVTTGQIEILKTLLARHASRFEAPDYDLAMAAIYNEDVAEVQEMTDLLQKHMAK